MEVEILPFMGVSVAGMEYTGTDPEGIVQLWTDFVQQADGIPGKYPEDDGYGILMDYDPETGDFTYMAGTAWSGEGELPRGMTSVEIGSGTYAVFTFEFDMVDEIYGFVYDEWLPVSGWVRGGGCDFEYYPEEFVPSDEGVLMQLYVSVEEAE
ncbi:MAG: hypothetical protein AVO35_09890 [Candidatus Aegiribacteria sp. MLS_C]|nr:MAG: hypothetical protein AVO35_09890 [Candidatus Aegiribacteria sp. MLS_C]